MILPAALTICTGLLWAGVGVVSSRVVRRNQDYVGVVAWSSLISTIGSWIIIPHYSDLASSQPDRWIPLVVIQVSSGIVGAVGMFVMNRAMRIGHHGGTWTIGQSALVVPFLAGLLLWGDRASLLNIVGVVTILGGIASLGLAREPKDQSRTMTQSHWVAVAIASLLLLGTQQTLTTISSRWDGWEDVGRLRVPLVMTGGLIGYQLLRLFGNRRRQPVPWREVGLLVAVSVPAQLLLYWALDLFAARSLVAIVYPLAIGTCIVAFAVYSLVAIHEEAKALRLIGIALSVCGVVLVTLP